MAGARKYKVREACGSDPPPPCPLRTLYSVPKVVLTSLGLTNVMCIYLDLPLANLKVVFFSYEKLKKKDGHSMAGFDAREKVYLLQSHHIVLIFFVS